MFILRHEGRAAAWVSDQRVSLADWVLDLNPSDPLRRWMFCRGFFVLELQGGFIGGEFSDLRADHFSRSALMPDEEFAQISECEDAVIAEHFGVPVAQVAEKRLDIQVHTAAHR